MSDHGLEGSAMDPQHMTQELGHALLRAIPPNGDRIEFTIRALDPFTQSTTRVITKSGDSEWVEVPYEIDDIADDLRAAMYRPGAGTWFSAKVTVTAGGSMDADFNYDDEPDWLRPVEPIWYVQDLERFPREESAIPDWLRGRLAEASS